MHMRGGLICIILHLSVRLFVTGPEFRLDNNSNLLPDASCKSVSQSWLVASLRVIGRCAHFNVNSLRSSHFSIHLSGPLGDTIIFGEPAVVNYCKPANDSVRDIIAKIA